MFIVVYDYIMLQGFVFIRLFLDSKILPKDENIIKFFVIRVLNGQANR